MEQQSCANSLPFAYKEYNNHHIHGNNKHYEKYIILTHPRTGSNHLVAYLGSNAQIISFGELFNPRHVWFNYPGYPKSNSATLLNFRDNDVKAFLNGMIFRNYASNIGAVGFKIFYEKLESIPYGKRISYGANIWSYLTTLPDLKVIHLKRRNLFEAYVSLQLAMKTNVWIKTQGKNSLSITSDQQREKITVSYSDCLNFMQKIQESVSDYTSLFAGNQKLEIYYEDLVLDNKKVLKKIQRFLNVNPTDLTSYCEKQHTEPVSLYVSNYNELVAGFKGSDFARFFNVKNHCS